MSDEKRQSRPATPSQAQVTEAVSLMARMGVYSLCVMALMLLLHALTVRAEGARAFDEAGDVECLQVALLWLGAATFGMTAWRFPAERAMALLASGLLLLASVREFDSALDRLLPLGWKLPAGVLLTALIVYVAPRVRSIIGSVVRLLPSPAAGILWVGFVVVVVGAQLIGHGDFLRMILGDTYENQFKRVIEESCEVLGYTLLVIGAVECWWWASTRRVVETVRQEQTVLVPAASSDDPSTDPFTLTPPAR